VDVRDLVERYKTLPIKAETMHWTQTAAGKKKLSQVQKARWAKQRNGANGHVKTIVSMEYLNEDGKLERVYLRRKDDPKPSEIMAAHA